MWFEDDGSGGSLAKIHDGTVLEALDATNQFLRQADPSVAFILPEHGIRGRTWMAAAFRGLLAVKKRATPQVSEMLEHELDLARDFSSNPFVAAQHAHDILQRHMPWRFPARQPVPMHMYS